MLPGIDGYEVCERLRRDPATADIPVIFSSGLDHLEDETRGRDAGAADYIVKPFSPKIVRAAIRNQLELRRTRAQLAELATVDEETGLANRRRMDEVLEQEVKRLRRDSADLSLIVLGLEEVPADARLVASVLSGVVDRVPDVIGRYGSTEFACVLPETDVAGAMTIARRIETGIAALGLPHAIGVATVNCVAIRAATEVARLAKGALQRAKTAGEGRIVAAETSTRSE